jgi:hypothetical protein
MNESVDSEVWYLNSFSNVRYHIVVINYEDTFCKEVQPRVFLSN